MLLALGLLLLAASICRLGPRWLLASWSVRAPRVALLGWLTASASLLAATVAGGLVLATSATATDTGLAHAVHACLSALHHSLGVFDARAVVAWLGLCAALVVVMRSTGAVTFQMVTAMVSRRSHRQELELVAERGITDGVIVVRDACPAVYCLPGRHSRIVVSSGALGLLAADELAAVMDHEKAHISGRHHLLRAISEGLARAFPRLRFFTTASQEVAGLLEMVADDHAASRHAPRALVRALLAVAGGAAPQPAMAAHGSAPLVRVRRLLQPRRRLPPAQRLGLVALSLAVLASPVALLASPTYHAITSQACIGKH